MIVDVIETNKDLFQADFSIIADGMTAGRASLHGRLGSMEGQWNGVFRQTRFSMSYAGARLHNTPVLFRPYSISVNQDDVGMVYQTMKKLGFLRRADYIQMQLDGITYDLFPVDFGNEGSKSPVYCGDKQIALIEKDCVVYDDLHKYHITAIDDAGALISVLFCFYMFTNACYKPGVKVTKSYSKTVSTTNERFLLEKYNPDFLNSMKG